MPNIGPMEIAIVLIIALVVFGPKRIPELAKSVGNGVREFRGSIAGDGDEAKAPKAVDKPPVVADCPAAKAEAAPAVAETRV
jgi:sec-independent protein translocase protein TatA